MRHPEFFWYEMRSDRFRRSLVQRRRVEGMVKSLGSRPSNVHISLYRYPNEAFEYSQTQNIAGKKYKGQMKGYRGTSYADYLTIDLDAEDASKLHEATDAAQTLVAHLEDMYGVDYDMYTVYFSSNRGFHFNLPITLFGDIPPSEHTPDALHEIAVMLCSETGLVRESGGVWMSDTIDMGIFARLHMIRMPHTVHPETMLWKIPVRKDELSSVDRIREVASENRARHRPRIGATVETMKLGDVVRERLSDLSFRYRKPSQAVGSFDPAEILSSDDLRRADLPGYSRYVHEMDRTMRALVGPIKEGVGVADFRGRNDALAHLAGKAKSRWRMSRSEATAILHLWNQQVADPPMDSEEFAETIKSIYDSM